MNRLLLSLLLAAVAGSAAAQAPPADQSQGTSSYYPAPPPLTAPQVEKGAAIGGLTSPLADEQKAITRTKVDSDAEAQLFAGASKIVWGRYAKIKGAKPGAVTVTKQGNLWTVKGRIDSVAPGSEGDWATIDGTVESIAANNVVINGEVAFRVAKIDKGATCKVAGSLHFRRSGKSQTWRLLEGDNPCDGTQEFFDLVYDKPPAEKKPAPAPKKS
jgi:hypothetical protein